jgi:hypothetical protein
VAKPAPPIQTSLLGLVDELRNVPYPVVVRGGTPFLPPVTEDVPLDDLDPTHKGGEGAVFRDGGEQHVLKRWFAERLGDMRRSVQLLKTVRTAVERDPVLSRYVRVIAIHEEGQDWILRDWVTAKQTVAQAAGAREAVNAVVEAIGRMEAGGTMPEELRLLRSRIRDRSENLRWDGAQIVLVDMM